MASFDRIFTLAKKTGDRLIVFDSATGDGFAAIPIDEYEQMVTNPRSVEELTGDQLIEQINRDIARWRESREEEEDLYESGGSAPMRQEYAADMPWESAGDVLQDRYHFDRGFAYADEEEGDEDDDEDGWSDEEFDAYMAKRRYDADPFAPVSEPRAWDDLLAHDAEYAQGEEGEDDTWDDLPPEPTVEDLPRPIPPQEYPVEESWEEEPLEGDDEPVFFEEPV